jgi:8-oxo-dGTP diphosphatase
MADLAAVAPGSAARQVTRISAYALCVDGGRILLCRIAPGHWSGVGQWTLPGGGLDFGEAPADGALRELTEETGLTGEIGELAAILSWSGRWLHPRDGVDEAYHGIQVVYRVRITGGELRGEPDGSTDAARWFAPDELDGVELVDLAREGARPHSPAGTRPDRRHRSARLYSREWPTPAWSFTASSCVTTR